MPKVVGYFGVVASMKALSRRQKDRKLIRHPALRELIIERIKDGWTPEQIADRLNATPRKCLRWETLAEVFKERILDRAA